MRKTEPNYWEEGYRKKAAISPLALPRGSDLSVHRIWRILNEIAQNSDRVVEIGGGGSQWLARLAIENPGVDFTALDYSRAGLALIADFATAQGLENLAAMEADLFDPPEGAEFDLVYSLGVVEHFSILRDAMRACARYLAPDGTMVTVIPNMAGILGRFTKRYNRRVYDLHNPHDLASFLEGHERVGLAVVEAGYLGTTNFGVLSSCFSSSNDKGYNTYVWLSRLTKIIDRFESALFDFPTSRFFSPYIYSIARHAAPTHQKR